MHVETASDMGTAIVEMTPFNLVRSDDLRSTFEINCFWRLTFLCFHAWIGLCSI